MISSKKGECVCQERDCSYKPTKTPVLDRNMGSNQILFMLSQTQSFNETKWAFLQLADSIRRQSANVLSKIADKEKASEVKEEKVSQGSSMRLIKATVTTTLTLFTYGFHRYVLTSPCCRKHKCSTHTYDQLQNKRVKNVCVCVCEREARVSSFL